MPNSKLKSSVLNEIKEKGMKPKPRWEFLLKNWVIWVAFSLSVLLGAIATSVAIFVISINDFDAARRLGHSRAEYVLQTFPYFWLFIFLGFLFLAYYEFKHTEKGYKFRLPAIIGANLIVSIILGFALFGLGTAKRIDNAAINRLPFYHGLVHDRNIEIWTSPEKGLLAGEVINSDGFTANVRDFTGEEWQVNINQNTRYGPGLINPGNVIRIFGKVTGDHIFDAEEIHPWKINGRPGNIRPPKRPNTFLKENVRPVRSE